MTAEIHFGLKIGKIEIDYEGSEKIFDSKISPIVSELIEFGKTNFADASTADALIDSGKSRKPGPTIPTMTVKSIAMKLGVGSGSELLYAAVASLAVLKKKETFTRHELNDEMKQATGYYKASYTSNLSNYIDTLSAQGAIIETSKDTYAAQGAALAVMEQKLAQ